MDEEATIRCFDLSLPTWISLSIRHLHKIIPFSYHCSVALRCGCSATTNVHSASSRECRIIISILVSSSMPYANTANAVLPNPETLSNVECIMPPRWWRYALLNEPIKVLSQNCVVVKLTYVIMIKLISITYIDWGMSLGDVANRGKLTRGAEAFLGVKWSTWDCLGQ